jgi:hypothetical protein
MFDSGRAEYRKPRVAATHFSSPNFDLKIEGGRRGILFWAEGTLHTTALHVRCYKQFQNISAPQTSPHASTPHGRSSYPRDRRSARRRAWPHCGRKVPLPGFIYLFIVGHPGIRTGSCPAAVSATPAMFRPATWPPG